MDDKKALRKEVLSRRDLLTAEEVEEYSESIAGQLFSLPEYQAAQTVMYFLNFGTEVRTLAMVPRSIRHGKRVVAPKTVHAERRMILSEIRDVKEDLVPGMWQIPEPREDRLRPVEPAGLDFVIVPGVAFDGQGNRLGYGGGYYDRFFALLRKDVPLVAVAFELQILDAVPVAPWDRRVDIIVTEKRVIDCRRGSTDK